MRSLSLVAVLIFLAACGSESEEAISDSVSAPEPAIEMPAVNTESSATYEEAQAAAVAAIDQAAAKGHAWTTSDQLIKDAADAAANGDSALAISLADEARIHADLASAQADSEALTWRDNVITE